MIDIASIMKAIDKQDVIKQLLTEAEDIKNQLNYYIEVSENEN